MEITVGGSYVGAALACTVVMGASYTWACDTSVLVNAPDVMAELRVSESD